MFTSIVLHSPTGSRVNITPLPPLRKGDITFTPVVLNSNKSISIFGMRATLSHSEEGTSTTDWACSIFLIGKNNEIVAATETTTTRYSSAYVGAVIIVKVVSAAVIWSQRRSCA